MSRVSQIGTAIATPVDQALDERTTSDILSGAPFVQIPGTFNSRDLSGGYICRKLVYRSGTLENTEAEGWAALKELGIRAIFDLRSRRERQAYPSPEMPDITTTWTPSTVDEVRQRGDQAENLALIPMYVSILDSHAAPFKAVFRYILEYPNQPVLIHCTAGRDRTGVLAALIHAIAGSPLVEIERDYALTRVGIEPVRDFLMKKWSGNKPLDLTDPKVRALTVAPDDAMKQLLEAIGERYGGVQQYFISTLGFSVDEFQQIWSNLQQEQH